MTLPAKIFRDQHGIFHVEGPGELESYQGLGYCHAQDRGMQMLIMRILGQGRACEILDDSDEMLLIDTFFRRMNWAGEMDAQLAKLSPHAREVCQAYCQGVNQAWRAKYPWEFKLVGYKPQPWKIEDCMLISRMIGYLTLAQSQGEAERLCLEMIQAGISRERLEELFPGMLAGLDVELVKKVKLDYRLVPSNILWNIAAPVMMASNNWVVSGKKTASGLPILASDPHLEVNRLPNVWYEIVLKSGWQYSMGATMPGLPGILIGRTHDISWGATYTFMDAIDSWVEECQEGKYRRENSFQPFKQRKETILRKKHPSVEVVFYENEHGVLEGNPFEKGFYLSTLWASAKSGAASMNAMLELSQAQEVSRGMELLGQLETSWNWVLADRHGNIGYQMSGLMPKRRAGVSGFVPLPGWDKQNDWAGFVPPKELPRCYNPEAGFFVTANHNLNQFGQAKPINICMSSHRAERITHLLEKGQNLKVQDMFPIHMDTYSLQAARYMEIVKPLLPSTPQGRILRDWDLCYSATSQGAYLFEQFYLALCEEVFGEKGFGVKAMRHLVTESGIWIAFFDNLDRILLAPHSAWFAGEPREAIYQRALAKSLSMTPRSWGSVNTFILKHLMLGGKFPRLLGFDRGPFPMIGGRATPHQGQIFRAAGRDTSFGPSFRMVTDMSNNQLHTNLIGGPSDRRFSKWYCSDIVNWLTGKYKIVSP